MNTIAILKMKKFQDALAYVETLMAKDVVDGTK